MSLKKCPFVQAHGTDWLGMHTDGSLFWIECWMHRVFADYESKCCVGPKMSTEEEAVHAWNHRPFESHAVEVLADKLHQIGTTNAYLAGTRYMEYDLWEMAKEETKDKYRAEARELLGIKDNNEKEKTND